VLIISCRYSVQYYSWGYAMACYGYYKYKLHLGKIWKGPRANRLKEIDSKFILLALKTLLPLFNIFWISSCLLRWGWHLVPVRSILLKEGSLHCSGRGWIQHPYWYRQFPDSSATPLSLEAMFNLGIVKFELRELWWTLSKQPTEVQIWG
jgi:hypothetical protein